LQKQLAKSYKASLTAIEKDRKAIDMAIDELIEGDERLKQLLGLMTSIPRVGYRA
jgi:hypothetical protein